MATATDRLIDEQLFHDHQARLRGRTFDHFCERLPFDEAAYLDHETWIRPALHRLLPLEGRDVLEYGCGHGMMAVVLARHGARVTAIDLSPGYLCEAARRAAACHMPVRFVQADGARLPFADGSFDRVWGNAVLHHLEPAVAGRELHRVLRPGGVAVFCEPWGENPLLRLARRFLPYPGKARTRGEEPLRAWQVRQLRTVFPGLEFQGYQLLSMPRRVAPHSRLVKTLQHWDDRLLPRLPFLQHFCRYAVLTLRREDSGKS